MAFAQPPLSPGAVALVQTSNAGPFRSSPPHRSGPKKDTCARNSANRRRLWYKAGLGGPRFGIKPGPVEHCLRPFEIALHLPGPHTRAKSRLLAVGGQNPARRGLSAGGNRIRTIGTAEKETAVESGPAADHRRLARRPVLNDPIQLIGSASLVGNSRETFHKSGTDGSNPVPSSSESASRGILPSHGEKPAFRAGVWARQVQRGQQRRVSRGAWRRQA